MWSYSKAVAAIEQFGLVEKNMRLACYWLSLWDGDAPPTRESFDPRKVVELLPGIGLVDMHEDKGPICRLAGTAIDRALGRPVTGTNLLDFLPEKDRGTRLTRLNAILDGGISVSRTAFSTRHGTSNFVETLQLPLYGRCETGTRQYLAHANWRPNMGFAKGAAPGLKLGLPDTFELVSFA